MRNKSRDLPTTTVICTDRGRHPKRTLQRLTDRRYDTSPVLDREALQEYLELCEAVGVPTDVDPERDAEDPQRSRTVVYAGPATTWTSRTGHLTQPNWAPGANPRPQGGRTWRFECPTCKRCIQFRDERMKRVLDALYAANLTVLDVSYSD